MTPPGEYVYSFKHGLRVGVDGQFERASRELALSQLRGFPQHAKLAERLEAAINYAEGTFGHAVDRERFIRQARNRIAERIAEGRSAAPSAPEKATSRGREGWTR